METLSYINGILKNGANKVVRSVSSIWTTSSPKPQTIANQITPKALKLAEIANRREVLLLLQSSNWIRIAGLFGATAVAMGAYGAHGLHLTSIYLSIYLFIYLFILRTNRLKRVQL
jgi:ABC-type arginine/histidine transport system permease subunit